MEQSIADKVERALENAGIEVEEFSTDEENGTILVRIAKPEPVNPVVTWNVYAHSSKDSMYEAALDAGLTVDEIEKNPELMYVGYEIEGKITFNRETGEIKEEWGVGRR